MRFLKDSEQRVTSKRKPNGWWIHGRSYAICPKCRERIVKGSKVVAAPGRAGTIKHLRC